MPMHCCEKDSFFVIVFCAVDFFVLIFLAYTICLLGNGLFSTYSFFTACTACLFCYRLFSTYGFLSLHCLSFLLLTSWYWLFYYYYLFFRLSISFYLWSSCLSSLQLTFSHLFFYLLSSF